MAVIVAAFDQQLTHSVAVALSELSDAVQPALTQAASNVSFRAIVEHGYKDQTGTLTRSIKAHPAFGQLFGSGLDAEITADAPHASPIEFGSKAHPITARGGGFLKFTWGGRTIYLRSVKHPGNRAFKFLADALDNELDEATAVVLDGALKAFRLAGFEVR